MTRTLRSGYAITLALTAGVLIGAVTAPLSHAYRPSAELAVCHTNLAALAAERVRMRFQQEGS